MRAPDFWQRDGVAAALLTPAGWLYDMLGRLNRGFFTGVQADVPVICVGNLVAGGAGKTPTAIAVARALIAQGMKPHFLTRGYGGKEQGPVRVDRRLHEAAEVGDESLLLARVAPTWVSVQRPAGAAEAIAAGADVIVMDDGYQNPSLRKDLSLVVIDGSYGFGNGRVMPAGPLRESVRSGLARADAVVLVGDNETDAMRRVPMSMPVLNARVEAAPEAAERFAGQRVLAFAGIGRPEKFFDSLTAAGAEVVETRSFADHHGYTADELAELRRRAEALQARLITTEKDFVRLPAGQRDGIDTLPVHLVWESPNALDRLLAPLIEQSEQEEEHG